MATRHGANSDKGFILKKKKKKKREKRKKNPVSRLLNNPIYPLLSTWTEPEAL